MHTGILEVTHPPQSELQVYRRKAELTIAMASVERFPPVTKALSGMVTPHPLSKRQPASGHLLHASTSGCVYVHFFLYLERTRSSGGNMKAAAYYVQIVASMYVRAQHKQMATLASPLLAW